MHLRVIQGGRQEARQRRPLCRQDIEAEAARRNSASGYDRAHARMLAIGEPIPKPLLYLKIQIAWVVDALSGLEHVPDDFADDRYWPDMMS
jgi:hypothetical protein